MSKELLIITGPQGSGNHLFSKIFACSSQVYGWKELLDTYWIAHDREPFSEAWHDPSFLADIDIVQNYAVTSISCPYAYKKQTAIPDYERFILEAKRLKYNVKVAIIGRDSNVLRYQQERVRKTHSYPEFEKQLPFLMTQNPVFISTELLYLYREHYINRLSVELNFPINVSVEQLNKILETDPNSKYFSQAPEQLLDNYVRQVSGLTNTP